MKNLMKNQEFFELMQDNAFRVTEMLSTELNETFNGLNSLLYGGEMKEFVSKQTFTQVSSALANKRHVAWRKILVSLGVPSKYNDESDLVSDMLIPRLEVKGSASTSDSYNNWQGGKKYRRRTDKRIFFLSQECYDFDSGLKRLKTVIAYIPGTRFKFVGKTTNRTILYPKDIQGDIITSYEIEV